MLKKIIAGAIALTAVAAFAATVSAQTSSYVFTTDLTVGSTGPDVVALQSFLTSKGYLTIPAGVAPGYFGNLTQSAVSAYQSAKGITPTAGYFGPITRAAVNTDEASMTTTTTTPGCPAGAMFNSMTGAPCSTTTTTTPGCPAGAMFNSMTGASCTTTTVSTTNTGGEGSLTVRLSGTPANNANIQTSTDVPVYGLTLQAQGGDVTVDRIDLQVGDTVQTNPTTNENPSSLINTIKEWDNTSGTPVLLKTWSVGVADFIQDPNNSSIYYVRLSGLGFLVPNGQTKNLVFSFSTNGSIDTNRVVTIQGYADESGQLRTISADGVTDYYNMTGTGFLRTQTFQKPGASTLTISSDANTPYSNNYEVNTTNGVQGVIVGTFNAQSQTGDSKITDIYTEVDTGNNIVPSTLYLYDGSNLIDSQTVTATGSNTAVAFHNENIVVSEGTTKTLTLKVDMPSNTGNGANVQAGASTTVSYQTPAGNTSNAVATGIVVYPQYFYYSAPTFTLLSATASTGSSNQSGSSTSLSGTFVFKVHINGNGNSMNAFATDGTGFNVSFGTSPSSTTTVGVTKTVTFTPNNTIFADGGDYTVTVTALVPYASVAATGNYIFYLTTIPWTFTGTNAPATVNQTYGLQNWNTNPTTFIK